MKKILMCFLILLLSTGLIACGSSTDKSSSTNNEVGTNNQDEKVSEVTKEEVVEEVDVEDPGKLEFEEYMNQIRPLLSEDITQFGADYETLRQQSVDGEIDDYTFAERILDDLLPRGHQIQNDLEAIFPTQELRNTHDILIDMMSKNNLAFTEIVEAINAGDYSRITSANELLSEARSLERDYIYELKAVAADYGIEY